MYFGLQLLRFRVIAHPLKVHDDYWLVSHHPTVVPRGQEGYVTWSTIKLTSVIHANSQHSRHVVLKMWGFAALGLGMGWTDVDHRQPGSKTALPIVATPILISSMRPFGNSRTSSGFPKLFSSAFLSILYLYLLRMCYTMDQLTIILPSSDLFRLTNSSVKTAS